MKSKELINLGIPSGPALALAHQGLASAAAAGMDKASMRATVRAAVADPDAFSEHPHFGEFAREYRRIKETQRIYKQRDRNAPYRQWGSDLEAGAVDQMRNACRLPISLRGALMPDAHQGYGLPIGGVLATDNAVIPYAVGVDIACRMKLTAIDLPVDLIDKDPELLIEAIESETRFGIGANFKRRRDHDVMDDDWSVTRITNTLKDKAWNQLGTSGSGNHFVEFGILTFDAPDLGMQPGRYLALLSHSGSRGAGATIASHYSKLACRLHPELPKELTHLAWLEMDSEEGREYWEAMNLMGRYAAANHDRIHFHIAQRLGAEVLLDVENHHNFAWKETHDGREMIVHRKGATPAGRGVLGVIPGSMASPAYLVRGKGDPDSLESAAHGAGRVMSRTAAKKRFNWREVQRHLDERGVRLISAGIDEVPMVYKNIDEVMQAQTDLVDKIARFEPKLVKMAPEGERPED